MRMLGVVALAALAGLPGSAGAGCCYVPPPGDTLPQWSPDGQRIAYETTRGGHAVAVATVDGRREPKLLVGDFKTWNLSPDWRTLAYASTDGRLRLKELG